MIKYLRKNSFYGQSVSIYAADTDKNKVSVFHGFMFHLIFAKDVFSLLGCFGRLIN